MSKKNRQQKKQQRKQNTSHSNSRSNSRKLDRYLSKRNVQTIKEMPYATTKAEFEHAKLQYAPLQEEANRRIELIQAHGLTSYALDRVISETSHDYFDISEINTREDLITAVTRMRVFINDMGSTVEGARLDTAQIFGGEYKGKFGNEYNTDEYNHARYDINVIDRDYASRAFESYRKLEQSHAAEMANDGGYGSENLIIALYDAEIRGRDSLMYGKDLLETFKLTHDENWQKSRERANVIKGITGDIDDNLRGGYLC